MKVSKYNNSCDDIVSNAATNSNTEYSITIDQTNTNTIKYDYTKILKKILYFIIGFTPITITSIILYTVVNDYDNFYKYKGLVIAWCSIYLIVILFMPGKHNKNNNQFNVYLFINFVVGIVMLASIGIVAGTTYENNKNKQDDLNKCNLLVKAYNITNINCNELTGHCFDILAKVPAAFQNKSFNCTAF